VVLFNYLTLSRSPKAVVNFSRHTKSSLSE
jgi:hypothetical protein